MARKSKQTIGDAIALRGCIEYSLRNALTGDEVQHGVVHNTVVTAGRSWVLMRIQSSSPPSTTLGFLACGSSNTAPATGNTALGGEVTRIAITSFVNAGTSASTPYWQALAQFATNEANTTINEFGLFNSSSNGTMLSRVTTSDINKTNTNTLTVTYTISN
jgi:hypothetical protein